MGLIERIHWPRPDEQRPERVILWRGLMGKPRWEQEYVPAEQLRGAVERADDLRTHVQGILDADYHYAEEYRWSLQEVLDADAGGR